MTAGGAGIIRRAEADDRAAVEAIVQAAYSPYIASIGKPPAPMLDDYAALIAAGAVHVLEDAERAVAGLIVLLPRPDHLLLDTIAVRPERQGQGLGRRLIAFAEAEARRLGDREVRLYTHALMKNVALYRRFGFAETDRRREHGYDRVFMRKILA